MVNHEKLYRVYRAVGLSLRRKKRKHCAQTGQPLQACTAANGDWALDFAGATSCLRMESGRGRLASVTKGIGREQPSDLVQGTLDMLLLGILAFEPINGLGVSQRLKRV